MSEGIAEVYKDSPDSAVLTIFAETVTESFSMIADQEVKVVSCHKDVAAAHKHDFTIYQDITGGMEGRFCLNITTDMLKRIAAGLLGEEMVDDEELALSGAAEFVNMINGNVCTKLSSTGITCEMKPPVACDNRGAASVDFASQIQGAAVTITPLLHESTELEFWVVHLNGAAGETKEG